MKVVILGSSVTRDAVDVVSEDHDIEVDRYFARSALASALGPAPFHGVEVGTIESDFRRGLVEADLASTFLDVIRGGEFDLIVYDPVDERFDLLEREDGARATLSGEFAEAGYDVTQDDRIASGTDDAFNRWATAWDCLVTELRDRGMLDRLRVNQVFWATTLEDGTPLPDRFSAGAVAAANEYLGRIYAVVAASLPESQVYSYADEDLVAAVDHRWGVGPVHFADRYYRRCAAHLEADDHSEGSRWARSLTAIDTHLIDRSVRDRSFVDLRPHPPRQVETRDPASVRLRSRGAVTRPGRCVSATFEGDLASYEFAIDLAEPLDQANGIAVRFRIAGWESVRYVALGYTGADGSFTHIKAKNPRQGVWETVCWSLDDLVYLIANDFQRPPDGRIADVRVWVSGKPLVTGGSIDLAWVGAWSGERGADLVMSSDQAGLDRWISSVVGYIGESNVYAVEQAELHLRTGGFPVIETILLDWPDGAKEPVGLQASTTYEHRFHAHAVTAALLKHAVDHDSEPALRSAERYVSSWLDHHAMTTTPHLRYVWYDHATAERLITLDLLYVLGTRRGLDAGLLERVRAAIVAHAQLLESAAYYAQHQSYRYHNHAWFQDLALLVTAEIFEGPQTDRWRAVAMDRFADQLDHLFAVEHGYVVSVENSIGYHSSMSPLIGRFAALVPRLAEELDLAGMRRGLDAFRELLRYPDHRVPAQGDTFRRPSLTIANRTAPVVGPRLTVLERSGYAVATGGADQPFQVTVFATGLSPTHKHADNLSFTAYCGGVEWLGDPSFYSHEYEEPVTHYVRGPWAHSQALVPEVDYLTSAGLARLAGHETGSGFDISGSHRAQPGVTVYRTIAGSWDSFDLRGTDRLTVAPGVPVVAVFHLGEDVSATLDQQRIVLAHPGVEFNVELTAESGTIETVTGWNGAPEASSVIATTYQQYVDSTSVQVHSVGPQPLVWRLRQVTA